MKSSIEQDLRNRNLGVRNAVVKNQVQNSVAQKSLRYCWEWKANGQWPEGDNCNFRHDVNKHGKWHSRIRLRILSCNRMSEKHRETQVPEERVRAVNSLDGLARITSKELPPIHSVKNGILWNTCSTSQKIDANLVKCALTNMVTKLHWLHCKLHEFSVSYVKIWSCRSPHRFYRSAQTYWSQSDVFDSRSRVTSCQHSRQHSRQKPIAWNDLPRWSSPEYTQFSHFSGSVSWRDGMARTTCPWSSVEADPIDHTKKNKRTFFSPSEKSVCLHRQHLNRKNENLVWTPMRQDTWSAKGIWVPLNWKPSRHQEVRRRLKQPMGRFSKNWVYSWQWKSSKIRQQF